MDDYFARHLSIAVSATTAERGSGVRQESNLSAGLVATRDFCSHCSYSQTGITEGALLDKSATTDNLKQLLERRDLVSRERLDHLFHMTGEDADLLLKASPQLFFLKGLLAAP